MLKKDTSVVVIGSGITGLCIGALLSRKGYSVTVLEKHPESFGGHARSFYREGFWFCCGPQYLWNFRNGQIGPRLLKYLGLTDKVPIEAMDPNGFERCFIGDKGFIDIPMGLDRFKKLMIERFPYEKNKLLRFFRFIETSFETCDQLNDYALYTEGASKILPFIILNKHIRWRSKIKSLLYSLLTLETVFNNYGISQEARRLLYAHSGIFLENESEISCLAYGVSTAFYHSGADFPKLGFRNMVESIVECIRENGGKVELGKEVTFLQMSKNSINKIICKDGSEYSPGFVLSNIAPSLIKRMLKRPSLLRYNYKPSHSCVGLFLGVAGHPDLPFLLDRKNIWWQDGVGEVDYNNPDMKNPRMLYICSPTCNSVENRNERDDYHSIMVFTAGNFQQDEMMRKKGIEEYAAFRDQILENHLCLLEKHIFKDLRKHIKYTKLLTPTEFDSEINLEQGAIYGRRAIPRNLLIKPIRKNKINNLKFACATTGAAGIASGFQTAAVLFEGLTGDHI